MLASCQASLLVLKANSPVITVLITAESTPNLFVKLVIVGIILERTFPPSLTYLKNPFAAVDARLIFDPIVFHGNSGKMLDAAITLIPAVVPLIPKTFSCCIRVMPAIFPAIPIAIWGPMLIPPLREVSIPAALACCAFITLPEVSMYSRFLYPNCPTFRLLFPYSSDSSHLPTRPGPPNIETGIICPG